MDIYIQNLIISKSINDHYTTRYIKFISNYLNQEKIKNETEQHHILPKCKDLFPEYKSLYKNPWNSVHLTKRQHFIAHWMLCKVFGESQIRAFWLMCRGRNVIPSKLYEKLKYDQGKQISKISKGNKHGKGQKRTPEQIKNLSEMNKKDVEFISPEGRVYTHKGLKDFCVLHNLNYNCIKRVVMGIRSHHKGWKCKYINDPYQEFIPISQNERAKKSAEGHKKIIHFISPDGIQGSHKGVADFCKTYKLNISIVRMLIKGERSYYKGWEICIKT